MDVLATVHINGSLLYSQRLPGSLGDYVEGKHIRYQCLVQLFGLRETGIEIIAFTTLFHLLTYCLSPTQLSNKDLVISTRLNH